MGRFMWYELPTTDPPGGQDFYLNGPMEAPGGDRVAQCMGPQGATLALPARGA